MCRDCSHVGLFWSLIWPAIRQISISFFFISLLHVTRSKSTALPYDVPLAQNYKPLDPCIFSLPPSSRNYSAGGHGRGTFKQPIDHDKPELGFFSQSFLWNSTFWRPGAPIVVFLPGETRVDGFGAWSRPEFSTVGVIAQQLGAAVVMPEHRYYGSSSPYTEFTRENLRYLTVDNALRDVVRFANSFAAPWTDIPSTAKNVPWILIGGSYSAAQAAWVANLMPGTFWAYIAASPILQAIPSYWAHRLPMVEHFRGSCIRLLSKIIQLIDHDIEANDENVSAIKELFGVTDMETSIFLYHLSFELGMGADSDVGEDNTAFETHCSWIEGREDKHEREEMSPPPYQAPPQNNTSIKPRADWAIGYEQTLRALQTFATSFKRHVAPRLCFLGTCIHDTIQLDEPFREMDLWSWLQCNDKIGGHVTGAPVGATSTPLVSRFLTYDFFEDRCKRFYLPGMNGGLESARHPTAASFNEYTGGWFPTNASRIIYSAGEMDRWREMSASATLRPGGPMKSDPEKHIVVHLVKTGWHHSEMSTRNTELDAEVRRVRDAEVDQVCRWVQQWPGYV